MSNERLQRMINLRERLDSVYDFAVQNNIVAYLEEVITAKIREYTTLLNAQNVDDDSIKQHKQKLAYNISLVKFMESKGVTFTEVRIDENAATLEDYCSKVIVENGLNDWINCYQLACETGILADQVLGEGRGLPTDYDYHSPEG